MKRDLAHRELGHRLDHAAETREVREVKGDDVGCEESDAEFDAERGGGALGSLLITSDQEWPE